MARANARCDRRMPSAFCQCSWADQQPVRMDDPLAAPAPPTSCSDLLAALLFFDLGKHPRRHLVDDVRRSPEELGNLVGRSRRLVFDCRLYQAAMLPAHVSQPAFVGRTRIGAPPRCFRGQIEQAEPGDLAARIGTALEVLAFFAHRHVSMVPPTGGVTHGPQPTDPSICSSINRLHSTAYSMGSVLVTGSMKPFTIIPIACDSERPRLIK
jgi:hypothetical protein